MMYLRIFLFLGLILHKIVWEAMKRGGSTSRQPNPRLRLRIKSVVKTVKVLVLLFFVVQTLFLNILPISDHPGALRLVGIFIYILGLAIAIVGRVQLGKNWANLEDYQVLENQKLVKSGVYRYVRHPIYTGDMLLILGLELALNSWLVVVVLVLMLIVVRQTQAEEVVLERAFPEYGDYRKQTKMFIPFLI